MPKLDDLQRVEVVSRKRLRTWLGRNHDSADSYWLVTFKKHVTKKYLSRDDVLEELICFGWIDGSRRKLDEDRTMQLICKRKSHHWAESYKKIAQKMRQAGLMHESGEAAIALAKRAGKWNLLKEVDKLEIPPDLKRAFSRNKQAKDFFTGLSPARKRFALRWIKLAKKEETRKNRISKAIELFNQGKVIPGS